MKEELLAQLLPIVEKTKEGILAGIEIAKEQFPQLINEIYRWEISIGVIGIVIGLIIAILMIKYCKKLYTSANDNEAEIGFYFGYIITGTISMIFLMYNICKAIKIIVAPRLYLLGYITSLLSK